MNTPDTEKCCEKCTDGSISGIWCNDESCSCHTPDTEWQEIANQIGLATYGGVSFQANPEYVEKIRNIISSRDTYWKERLRREDEESYNRGYADAEHDVVERVRKEVEGMKEQCIKAYHGQTDIKEVFFYNQALDTLLDNLK